MAAATEGAADAGDRATPGWARPAAAVHALLGSLPVGLFAGSVLFDVASHRAAEIEFARPSFWLLLVGLAVGVMVGLPGLALALLLPEGSAARCAALGHALLSDAALVLFGVSAALRKETVPTEPVAIGPAVVSAVALVALFAGRVVGLRLVDWRPFTSRDGSEERVERVGRDRLAHHDDQGQEPEEDHEWEQPPGPVDD